MDDVYRLYNKTASPKVDIKEYFDNYKKLVADYFISMKKDKDNFMSMMGVELAEEELSMLTNYCSGRRSSKISQY